MKIVKGQLTVDIQTLQAMMCSLIGWEDND